MSGRVKLAACSVRGAFRFACLCHHILLGLLVGSRNGYATVWAVAYSMQLIWETGMVMVVPNKVVTVTNPWVGVS